MRTGNEAAEVWAIGYTVPVRRDGGPASLRRLALTGVGSSRCRASVCGLAGEDYACALSSRRNVSTPNDALRRESTRLASMTRSLFASIRAMTSRYARLAFDHIGHWTRSACTATTDSIGAMRDRRAPLLRWALCAHPGGFMRIKRRSPCLDRFSRMRKALLQQSTPPVPRRSFATSWTP